ncbi:MAG: nucleotidyltransferase family protein [Sphingomonadales bacterium]|nr:nucleotidyltransferase family protein [Sphingomonadaceae bacterium]MBS3931143.1 nucleotidyltransferase family protein [Sphingomonadales bacterium]
MTYLARIEQHRSAIAELVHKRRAANPRLFGSALDEREGPQSDIDILVDALPGATLFDLGALQVELEELLGAPVDLLTPGDIEPGFRQRVLEQARPI